MIYQTTNAHFTVRIRLISDQLVSQRPSVGCFFSKKSDLPCLRRCLQICALSTANQGLPHGPTACPLPATYQFVCKKERQTHIFVCSLTVCLRPYINCCSHLQMIFVA
ncbi:hypothetical protein O6H91_Y487500 [Diphasiastrum complanatum]|nr:hypothetical protein O6H91_Y487500 [Diphasiastrum complanatum]